MELSPKTVDSKVQGKVRRLGDLGHCRHFFWLGVAFDAVGVAVLFTGIFADLLFYDMLLYLGSIIIFISLLWWVSWYTGNIEAFPEDPLRRSSHRSAEDGMHRSSSRRFTLSFRSISSTFLRMRRQRRRRRPFPRVLQKASSLSSTAESQLERQSVSCSTVEGDKASAYAVPPVLAANQPQRSTVRASKSLPVNSSCQPLAICTSRSQPVFSLTSPFCPLEPVSSQSRLEFSVSSDSQPQVALSSSSHVPGAPQRRSRISVATQSYTLEGTDSQSHLKFSVSSDSQPQVALPSDSHVPWDPQRRSKITVASQSYPLERADSRNHLLVPVASESFPMVPMISQSYIQSSLASQRELQHLPSVSQTQPAVVKGSGNQTLATQVPGVPPGFAQIEHFQTSLAQAPQSHSSAVQEVSTPSAEAFETLPAPRQKLTQEYPDTASSEASPSGPAVLPH